MIGPPNNEKTNSWLRPWRESTSLRKRFMLLLFICALFLSAGYRIKLKSPATT